jgi:hypothetical protein
MISTAENEQEIKEKLRQEKIEKNKQAFLEMTSHVYEGMQVIYHERFTFLCKLESLTIDDTAIKIKLKYLGYVGAPCREALLPILQSILNEKEVELGVALEFLKMNPKEKEVYGYGSFYVRFTNKTSRSSIFFSNEE